MNLEAANLGHMTVFYLWWLEWVVSREVDGQEENSSLVWAVWWAHDGGLMKT